MKKKLPAVEAPGAVETPLPMPSAGGVYVRLPDGTLQRQDEISETPDAGEQPLKDN